MALLPVAPFRAPYLDDLRNDSKVVDMPPQRLLFSTMASNTAVEPTRSKSTPSVNVEAGLNGHCAQSAHLDFPMAVRAEDQGVSTGRCA
jgi:hypothetical protein